MKYCQALLSSFLSDDIPSNLFKIAHAAFERHRDRKNNNQNY
jgi:hypothetical protein